MDLILANGGDNMNNYYSNNYKEFIDNTINCDMNYQYNFFLKYLPTNSKTILDLGFGSGRDSLFFKQKYDVYAIDPTSEFCSNAKALGINNVYNIKAQDMTFENIFDGIWACASLLHVSSNELNDVFIKCSKALKPNGIMYVSFKYGDFEGERNGRFFLDLNEETLLKYLKNTNLNIIDICVTDDVRPDRNEKWLNVILKK